MRNLTFKALTLVTFFLAIQTVQGRENPIEEFRRFRTNKINELKKQGEEPKEIDTSAKAFVKEKFKNKKPEHLRNFLETYEKELENRIAIINGMNRGLPSDKLKPNKKLSELYSILSALREIEKSLTNTDTAYQEEPATASSESNPNPDSHRKSQPGVSFSIDHL